MRLALAFPIVLAASLFAPLASAVDKAACVEAYDKTQALRSENKLRAAREQLLVCTQQGCPKLVRQDCVQWMNEVTQSLPSLVFSARDGRGGDRANVKVFIDGEAVSAQLGQEVIVDPGVHALRFEAPEADPVEQQIVVKAGEKSRAVSVDIPDRPKKEEPKPPPPPPPKPPPPVVRDETRPIPVLVPILGGVGVASLATSIYLGVSTASQLGDLESKCAPHCEQSDVDTLNLRYTFAGIAAGVGVLALGAAVYFYMMRPTSSSSAASILTNVGRF